LSAKARFGSVRRISLGIAAWCVPTLTGLSPALPARAAPVKGVIAHVVAAPIRERLLQTTTSGFGKVQSQPAQVLSIDARYAGTMSKVFVRSGQRVERGSPVAELSASAATEEAFHKAQTAEGYARAALGRAETLWKEGAATKVKLDQARVAFNDAKAALDAQKRIGAENKQITVVAPISGTVTSVAVAQGDQIQQNAKILSLAPNNALAVFLGVEPEDVGKVRAGLAVTLTPTFDPAKTIVGKVGAVNAVIDPRTRLVDVRVDVETNGGAPPLIGTQMRGTIVLHRERALAVPREAILYDRKGAYVFTVEGGHARRVMVAPGAEEKGVVAVRGRIKAGDPVVIQGNYELKDGMKVERADHAVR